MKKVLSILVLALVAVQFAFAGDVITQDTKQLPLTARNFINQYFSKPHISHIKIESEILQTKKFTSIEVQIPFRNPCGMGTERGLFRCRL